jgi:hypothetical protein
MGRKANGSQIDLSSIPHQPDSRAARPREDGNMSHNLVYLGIAIAVVSTVWVLIDAIEIHKGTKGAIEPFISCILIWVVAFPIYLIKRPREKRKVGRTDSCALGSIYGALSFICVVGIMILAYTGDIKASIADLEKEVRQSIQQEIQKKSPKLKVESLDLLHKSGNEYEGLVKMSDDESVVTVAVNVTYDGKRFLWKFEKDPLNVEAKEQPQPKPSPASVPAVATPSAEENPNPEAPSSDRPPE